MNVASIRPQMTSMLGVLLVPLLLSAGPAKSAERHNHDAHVHGVSKLNLVVDGNRLELELESPGADIVGFEHAAANDADRKAIEDAARFLKEGARLFVPAASAGCVLQSAEIATPEHEKHHAHDHGHKKSGHSHGHDHDHDKEKAEVHSEFHAHYRFACKDPAKLTHIDVKFFGMFPAAKEIEVQAVTPDRQFREELTEGKSRLTL